MNRVRKNPSRRQQEAQLRPFEDIDELELEKFKRHKTAGTSPGDPKWYKNL